MTRTTSTAGQLSVEELKHILDGVLMVCVLLKALEGILGPAIKKAETAAMIAKSKS